MKQQSKGVSLGLAIIGLAGSASYLNVNGHDAGWLWAGIVILFLWVLVD